MLNLDQNPPTRPPTAASLKEITGQWWVGHTKSRCEKAFAWDLCKRNIGYFLPMVEQITYSGGKKRRSLSVMFPSYVFFCGSPGDRVRALTTDRLCQVLEVHDQRRLRSELAAIERVLNHAAGLETYPFAEVGRLCRVVRGPLEGLEGMVLEHGHGTRLLLQVSTLGQSVALEIDAGLLEEVAHGMAASN